MLPFNVKAVAKHRTDDDWTVDDAMLSVKRSRMGETNEQRRNRNNLIKGRFFALLASANVTHNDSVAV